MRAAALLFAAFLAACTHVEIRPPEGALDFSLAGRIAARSGNDSFTSEPREYRAADSEALTERVLGFRLPIEGLAQTVQGKPSPALEARGWKVEYQEYDAQKRPTRLRLTNAGAEVRLAIHQWN